MATSLVQEGRLETEKFLIDDADTVDDSHKIVFNILEPNGNKYAGKYLAVSISDDLKIKLASSAETVIGRLEKVEGDGWATVAVRGDRMYFAKNSTATLGRNVGIQGSNEPGKVQTDQNGRGIVVDNSHDELVHVVFP